ncbi:phosphate signaling complex protein PhoU [Kutzneria sp. CA-103260]|uniref:phosphate signaling complex protein PhoU n=1 Tax=Kutzneria sp. CA-103260 TaxID=2802641 RepID=UPI001BA7DC42|nr:phosphate signaling complex protein PhoU [Kutzneria sp. CA-103260]QUQ64394.1 phosphate transport system protein [Kutzneria sp. CA-103260]
MRTVFRAQLDQCVGHLATMCDLAVDAMRSATQGLLNADLRLAEQVIADDALLDQARVFCEDRVQSLLALQSPVAGDLRVLIAALHTADTLERMGDLAVHVAMTGRRRHPHPVLPAQLRPAVASMAHTSITLADSAGLVLRNLDLTAAVSVERGDDVVDEQHRHLLTLLMSEDWPYGVTTAVDLAQLSRYYERYADHAVSVARRMIYVLTGQPRPPRLDRAA